MSLGCWCRLHAVRIGYKEITFSAASQLVLEGLQAYKVWAAALNRHA